MLKYDDCCRHLYLICSLSNYLFFLLLFVISMINKIFEDADVKYVNKKMIHLLLFRKIVNFLIYKIKNLISSISYTQRHNSSNHTQLKKKKSYSFFAL